MCVVEIEGRSLLLPATLIRGEKQTHTFKCSAQQVNSKTRRHTATHSTCSILPLQHTTIHTCQHMLTHTSQVISAAINSQHLYMYVINKIIAFTHGVTSSILYHISIQRAFSKNVVYQKYSGQVGDSWNGAKMCENVKL